MQNADKWLYSLTNIKYEKRVDIMIVYDKPFLNENDTLICWGDSLTSDRNSYVGFLAQKLAPMNINVINAGRKGDKTPLALMRLESVLFKQKFDALSIFLGVNDAIIGRGRWADEPFIAPQTFFDNMVWMISHIRTFLGDKKISVIVPYSPFEAQAHEEFGNCLMPYAQKARDAAALMKCRIVPLDVRYEEYRNSLGTRSQRILTYDDVHPTAESGKFTADVILQSWGMI